MAEDAISRFDTGARGFVDAHAILAEIYEALGRSDASQYHREKLWEVADGKMLLAEAKRLYMKNGKPPQAVNVESVVQLLSRAEERLGSSSPSESANVLRFKGEVLEEAGNTSMAIEIYRRALELNPKVGARNRLKKLEK